MKSFLDRFILGIPRLYIKQYLYAWIVEIKITKVIGEVKMAMVMGKLD